MCSAETAIGRRGSVNGISIPAHFPEIGGRDYVPEGRDRLGFQHWRGYNFHTDYFNGTVNLDDWRNETWDGYETDALNRYAFQFMDSVENDNPFCLFISPHQAHSTPYAFAPQEYYDRLPAELQLPENVPDSIKEQSLEIYRHYLAMTLTVDDMLGELMAYLERTGRVENTLLVFGSDHGTQGGAQGINSGRNGNLTKNPSSSLDYAAPRCF